MSIKIGGQSARPASARLEPQPRPHMEQKLGDKRASAIPCPMISVMLMENMLTPDKDGNVSVAQLKQALEKVGISALPRVGLAHFSAKSLEGSFGAKEINVFSLFGSSLDHKGSLGPLQDGGFNQHFLDQLIRASSDGKSLTLEDLGTAQLIRLKQEDGGGRDKLIGRAELAALMLIFGKPNANGEKALAINDLVTIFRDNRLPEDWKQPSVGGLNLAWTMTKLAFHQNTTAAGRAEMGLKKALEEPMRLDASGLKGLGAMCPAGMRPKGGVGVSEREVSQLHSAMQAG